MESKLELRLKQSATELGKALRDAEKKYKLFLEAREKKMNSVKVRGGEK